MVLVIIGILGLLVVHAAGTSTVTATIAAGAGPTPLPIPTPVVATGNAPSPSPATWGGAPGAASSWQTRINTNTLFPSVATTGIAPPTNPGLPGVPIAAVPRRNWNGFDSVPGSTKQLSVNRIPKAVVNTQNFGGNKL
jgi:hypothetical protein